eukprot:jgi/Tetstr1/466580/TSEL_000988.t1
MRDATQAQLDFMVMTELPRFEAIGAWERGRWDKWVSTLFLVPKLGTNKWRLIIDLRELNKWCKTLKMSYETLKHLRHLARAGARRRQRLLPYMDDFLFLADFCEAALKLRVRLDTLLDLPGMMRNPNKGVWEPTQVGPHLGRLLPARQLASFAGKAQFLYLAIVPARFFLRELHCALATRQGLGGHVKITNQLRRDLEWLTEVHAQHNGRSMYKPVETANLHENSSSYGWGDVLNNNSTYHARGFWYVDDRVHHITWKELRVVRHAVESSLPHLRGRRVLLHEDNTAVVAALTNLTSRSPVMMEELRKPWHLLDIHDISIRPRHIQSAANVWADRLCRELEDADWHLNPRIFAYLLRLWGPYTIDIFATMDDAQLPRYNSQWRDPHCEAVDSLHLPDELWRRERNYGNPPWTLLDDLADKLRQSGAAATVIALHWPGPAQHFPR